MPISDVAALRRRDGTVVRSWFAVGAAPPAVSHLIACTWRGDPGWDRTMRLLPDGCVDLTWDGTSLDVTPAVVGALTLTLTAGASTVGVRLRPHAAVAVLGRPAPTLAGPIGLDEIWPRRHVEQLTAELARSAPSRAIECLVAAVSGHAALPRHRPDPLLDAFVRRLDDPLATVDAAARTVGASTRELRRRLRNDTALTPRALHDVLRFRRAVTTLGTSTLADTAAAAGYCDQAHLARRTRAIVAMSPSQLATSRRRSMA